MVESMACATVPKIILTLNHASGAGYYAMAGQGFDPNFTFAWPTARIGVMVEADALDPTECRRYVEELFAPERMVADYVEAYGRAIDRVAV